MDQIKGFEKFFNSYQKWTRSRVLKKIIRIENGLNQWIFEKPKKFALKFVCFLKNYEFTYEF